MPAIAFPPWTMVPFPALVLAIALLPTFASRLWERWSVQALVVGVFTVPVLLQEATSGHAGDAGRALSAYASFVLTLAALYVTSGGVQLVGDVDPTPAANVGVVLVGSLLANLVGTTGASVLLVRFFLQINARREDRAHLVPFFIVTVANAGGLLTPLGDPPLLVGYLQGVPFFWPLRLAPAWLLYVGSAAAALYIVDRRAYAREPVRARAPRGGPWLVVRGKRNIALLLAVVPASLLPPAPRIAVLVAITGASLAATPRALRLAGGFSLAPIGEVAILFLGLFVTLAPIEAGLALAAPSLPLRHPWQVFWLSGLLSSILDNAPTYAAIAAAARGIAGAGPRVASMAPLHLAALSVGCVVMGATTYVGNGPNLLIRAIALRERFPVPSFVRYAAFAFGLMLPAHLVMTAALAWLAR